MVLWIRNWLGICLSLSLVLLVGCANESVAQWPAPNFNGPDISRGVAPRIAEATPPMYAHSIFPGIPQSWVPTSRPRDWQFIIIHHSATFVGGAKRFDREHRQRGFDELGYDFVIGNGTDTRDGQIEVGPRWPIQKWGAHDGTPDERFNNYGIGICLVGNFNIQHPSRAQLQSLAKLVAYLQATYHIPPNEILGHRDTKPTDCPGRNVSLPLIRRMAGRVLADAGVAEPKDTRLAGQLAQPSGE